MAKHRKPAPKTGRKIAAGAALAAGGFAGMALSSAGQASASCVSFSGLNNGNGCTTTNVGDTAIGIGPDTTVRASGGFNTAVAVGPYANATSVGFGNGSLAIGRQASATSVGLFNTAVAVGNPGPNNLTNYTTPTSSTTAGVFSRSFAFGNGSTATAVGFNANAVTAGNGSNSVETRNNRFSGAFGNFRNGFNGVNN